MLRLIGPLAVISFFSVPLYGAQLPAQKINRSSASQLPVPQDPITEWRTYLKASLPKNERDSSKRYLALRTLERTVRSLSESDQRIIAESLATALDRKEPGCELDPMNRKWMMEILSKIGLAESIPVALKILEDIAEKGYVNLYAEILLERFYFENADRELRNARKQYSADVVRRLNLQDSRGRTERLIAFALEDMQSEGIKTLLESIEQSLDHDSGHPSRLTLLKIARFADLCLETRLDRDEYLFRRAKRILEWLKIWQRPHSKSDDDVRPSVTNDNDHLLRASYYLLRRALIADTSTSHPDSATLEIELRNFHKGTLEDGLLGGNPDLYVVGKISPFYPTNIIVWPSVDSFTLPNAKYDNYRIPERCNDIDLPSFWTSKTQCVGNNCEATETVSISMSELNNIVAKTYPERCRSPVGYILAFELKESDSFFDDPLYFITIDLHSLQVNGDPIIRPLVDIDRLNIFGTAKLKRSHAGVDVKISIRGMTERK